jgi:sister chromatid cohesion protein DCC1
MILVPSSLAASPHDMPVAGVQVIATVHETFELVVEPEAGAAVPAQKNTGSKGKWHEKFGRGR